MTEAYKKMDPRNFNHPHLFPNYEIAEFVAVCVALHVTVHVTEGVCGQQGGSGV